jgi:ATP-binding cassette, subfamily B, multidrug efflux pump
MISLARYLKYFKKELMIGPFFKLLEAVFELIVPLVMASIIDIGIKNGDKRYVLERGAIILLLGIVGLLFALICQYSAARASQGFGTRVRNDLFAHINTLSHAELDQLGTNSLITVITNDVNQVQLAVAMLIRLVVRAPFLVIGATVMAMFLDLKVSLIFLAVVPVISFLLYIIMKKSIPFYRIRQKALDKISLVTRENLTGARVIRAFSRQEREEQRFEQVNGEAADIAIHVGKLSALLSPATFVIMNFAICAIIWFGGMRVNTGKLTQGEVIALINYMMQISLALVVVANLVIIFTKAAACATRINKIFDMKASISEGTYQGEAGDLSCDEHAPILSLRNISFAYPGSEEYALEDISFDIFQGETIGIIGGTGSGKSTLVNLLPRFYDVTEGAIKLEGTLLKEYTHEAIRSRFGIAPQKAVLFYGSIRDNLKMAKPEATEKELWKAIRTAQAEEFVDKLPGKLDYMIMQDGKNLSGGQKQRLTIARALVANPKLLILDDSSSALDYTTDAGLRRALKTECADMAILMVGQRAAAIKQADRIIVLEDGKLAGIGRHSELMESCEVYREICLSQLSEEEVNRG